MPLLRDPHIHFSQPGLEQGLPAGGQGSVSAQDNSAASVHRFCEAVCLLRNALPAAGRASPHHHVSAAFHVPLFRVLGLYFGDLPVCGGIACEARAYLVSRNILKSLASASLSFLFDSTSTTSMRSICKERWRCQNKASMSDRGFMAMHRSADRHSAVTNCRGACSTQRPPPPLDYRRSCTRALAVLLAPCSLRVACAACPTPPRRGQGSAGLRGVACWGTRRQCRGA